MCAATYHGTPSPQKYVEQQLYAVADHGQETSTAPCRLLIELTPASNGEEFELSAIPRVAADVGFHLQDQQV